MSYKSCACVQLVFARSQTLLQRGKEGPDPLSSCSVEGMSGDETMFASAMVAPKSTPCI